MKRTYKKKSNLINKTGYTPGYDTEKNPVNYIPSEDITMANTPYPLYATPLDENSNPIGKGMIMQPGGEYKFPNAAYVAETPMFAKGGEKSNWISAKISTLVREGYPQKQAVAIAYSMYEDMKKENGGFQLPMYQFGNTFPGSNFPKPKFSADPNIATPEQFSEQMNKITEVNPGKYGLGKDPNYVSPLSEESLTAGKDWAAKNPLPEGVEKPMSTNVFGAEVEDSSKNSTVKSPDIKTQEPFQFFNPYGGVDIPTAGVMFGQSLENKDTLGAVASGAKVVLGTARNILGGMGQARRENYMKQQYYEKQREGMKGAGREQMLEFGGYYQEGGMEEPQGGDIQQQVAQALQQGMSPEEVMQQLVQMGMPEDQAVALIQGVMQPSTPQLRRGGMMYYQDGGEQQVAQQVAQAMQQGMQPQEAMSMLMESGMTEDQALQMVQAIMEQLQQQTETPQLRKGGEMIKRADGSYSRRGLWDNIRDNRGSGKKPTKEMLEQEAKIKREYQEGGMELGGDPTEMIMQQVSQMLQQGAEPEQIMQMLIEAGVPEDQAMQMVQAVMQQMQGSQQPQANPQMRMGGGYYQQGGEAMDEQMEGEDEGAEGESAMLEQIESQVEQALKQGADPQQVLQQLVQMGVPQEVAQQMIEEILQEIEGGETEMEEPEEGTPQMSKGGKYMRALVGKTIKNYKYNPKTDSYIVSYE